MPSRSASRPVHRYWVNVNGRRVRKTHGARRKQPPGGVRRQKAAGNGPATPSSSSPGPATSSLFVSPAAVVDIVVRDTLKKTFARRKAASKTAPVSGELRCNVGSANPAYEPPSKGPQTNPKYIQRRRDYSDTSPFATHFAVAHPLYATGSGTRSNNKPVHGNNALEPQTAWRSPASAAATNGHSSKQHSPEVDAVAKRILAQRARVHHDDPHMHEKIGQAAAAARGRRHRQPDKLRPKWREQGRDGPLGVPRGQADKVNLLHVSKRRAKWGARVCTCNTFPCKHVPSLPANTRSRRVLEQPAQVVYTKPMSYTRQRALRKAAARASKGAFRKHAGVHNSHTFHRGRSHGV